MRPHSPEPTVTPNAHTKIDFQFTTSLPETLQQLGLSLLVSTYQAGKVVVVGAPAGRLQIRCHHFDQVMGLARTPTGLVVGARQQIWFLEAARELAPHVEPAGAYDCAFLTRRSHFTGPIMGHELAWGNNQLWVVNTLFSCLAVLHPDFSFQPRWKPRFISRLAAEDRCHLNGLAMDNGQPAFVTTLGPYDTAAGWRPTKATAGMLIHVPSHQVVASDLSMPHSPRLHLGRLWVLNSGHGRLCTVDPNNGRLETVAELPGYTRGLDFFGPYAFVGLSQIRETSVFGGLPIAERKADLKCGLAIVDLRTGGLAATLTFTAGVEEIFAICVVPGFRNPILNGPLPEVDDTTPIWLIPPMPNESSPDQLASQGVK